MRAEYAGVVAGPVRRAFEALTKAHNRLVARVDAVEAVDDVLVPAVQALQYDGVWDQKPIVLGTHYLWVDGSDRLRIHTAAPSSDTDGTVVGTQT